MVKPYQILTMIIFIAIITACGDEPTNPSSSAKDINELVRNAGTLQPRAESKNITNLKTEVKTTEENGIKYSSNSTLKKFSNKFDQITAFNSAYADALYPGAIVQGKDILNGTLSTIGNVERTPINITMSNGNSVIVNNPSKSSVSDGMKQLLNTTNKTAAIVDYTLTESYDDKQSFLEMGLDISWLPANMSAKFNQKKSVTQRSLLLYFKQIYYTISAETYTTPAEYFANQSDVEKLKNTIYNGNPPCYISSVDYGRIIIVKMTSEESYETMKSSLSAGYKIVNGKVQYDKSKFKSNTTFDAIVVGGSATGATNAVVQGNIESIHELITSEAEYSSDNPGFPISYSVKYLKDGTPVKLGTTLEYWEDNWQVDQTNYQKFDIYFDNIYIADDNNWGGDSFFTYKITITDKDGNEVQDVNGKDAIIEEYEPIKVGSRDNLLIGKHIFGIKLKKNDGEQLWFKIELYAHTGNGKKIAAHQDFYSKYPWQYLSSDYAIFFLELEGIEDYEATLNLQIRKY